MAGELEWDGEDYQRRFDELGASGADMHGEARFVRALLPPSPAEEPSGRPSVLDAGCGTGRVAIELAAPAVDVVGVDVVGVDVVGVDVVGVDVDASMLATARRRAPALTWLEADLAQLELDRTFDVVVMAGNVLLFTAPGAQAAVVQGCARHVRPGGCLVAGFQLGRGYSIEDYDLDVSAAGLHLVERWATWDRQAWDATSGYAVSVHRRRP